MIPLIDSFLTFATGGFYGGSIGNVLLSWEQAGFFSYILPFLLIFALVFGILTKVKLFPDNKPINAVIAIAIGLLSLQFNFVPLFFSEIFPRLGVGLAVILALFILVGLFLPQDYTKGNWFLLIVGIIVFVVVITKTFGYLGYQSNIGYYIQTNLGSILLVIGVIAVLASVITSGAKPKITAPGPQVWQQH